MTKNLLPLIGCLLIALPGWSQAVCRSFDYRQQQLKDHPSLVSAVESIEQFTRQHLPSPTVSVTGQGASSTTLSLSVITIPVVVHVLYNTSDENISDDQIISQIA